ncbi:RING zinc finger-containing protein [Reticulomyxa filosa]|uniref:RING zinc finger-containing protein n=1 Tax=Reticulomyxa filosa TaxID=46433 RepID=X6M6I3_RETFI|nr:RING zinc finger-containing protein [Reticulomyxa filosa]|eukprot:ETO09072.1 RING zinc finger-containing protein [Reticulomyxa filosa]
MGLFAKCIRCEEVNHIIENCHARIPKAISKSMCRNCCQMHFLIDCPTITCKICGKNHHQNLCPSNNKTKENANIEIQEGFGKIFFGALPKRDFKRSESCPFDAIINLASESCVQSEQIAKSNVFFELDENYVKQNLTNQQVNELSKKRHGKFVSISHYGAYLADRLKKEMEQKESEDDSSENEESDSEHAPRRERPEREVEHETNSKLDIILQQLKKIEAKQRQQDSAIESIKSQKLAIKKVDSGNPSDYTSREKVKPGKKDKKESTSSKKASSTIMIPKNKAKCRHGDQCPYWHQFSCMYSHPSDPPNEEFVPVNTSISFVRRYMKRFGRIKRILISKLPYINKYKNNSNFFNARRINIQNKLYLQNCEYYQQFLKKRKEEPKEFLKQIVLFALKLHIHVLIDDSGKSINYNIPAEIPQFLYYGFQLSKRNINIVENAIQQFNNKISYLIKKKKEKDASMKEIHSEFLKLISYKEKQTIKKDIESITNIDILGQKPRYINSLTSKKKIEMWCKTNKFLIFITDHNEGLAFISYALYEKLWAKMVSLPMLKETTKTNAEIIAEQKAIRFYLKQKLPKENASQFPENHYNLKLAKVSPILKSIEKVPTSFRPIISSYNTVKYPFASFNNLILQEILKEIPKQYNTCIKNSLDVHQVSLINSQKKNDEKDNAYRENLNVVIKTEQENLESLKNLDKVIENVQVKAYSVQICLYMIVQYITLYLKRKNISPKICFKQKEDMEKKIQEETKNYCTFQKELNEIERVISYKGIPINIAISKEFGKINFAKISREDVGHKQYQRNFSAIFDFIKQKS